MKIKTATAFLLLPLTLSFSNSWAKETSAGAPKISKTKIAERTNKPGIFVPSTYNESPVIAGAKYSCYSKGPGFKNTPIQVKIDKEADVAGVTITTPAPVDFCVTGLNIKEGTPVLYDFESLFREAIPHNSDILQKGIKTKTSKKIQIGNKEYFFIAEDIEPTDFRSLNEASTYRKSTSETLSITKNGVKKEYESGQPANFTLSISDGVKKFPLGKFFNDDNGAEGPTQAMFHILWSGDIDSDGKPDFYIKRHGGMSEDDELFISSDAENADILRSFALTEYSVGC